MKIWKGLASRNADGSHEDGLVGVLDLEFAHLGDPAEDLAPGARLAVRGGPPPALGHRRGGEPHLERYNALTGRDIALEELFYWEVVGKWGGPSARLSRPGGTSPARSAARTLPS